MYPSLDSFHHQCQTLPLIKFWEVIDTGELTHLIISGNPSPIELNEAWDKITREYGEILKTEKSENVFQLWKKIEHTRSMITFIERALMALKWRYDEEIASWLHNYGYSLITASEDRDEYLRGIYRVESEAKSLVVMLNQYLTEYKIVNPTPEEEITKPARIERVRDLMILSKFQGTMIRPESTSVMEYAAIVNLFIEHVNEQKKLANKTKRH